MGTDQKIDPAVRRERNIESLRKYYELLGKLDIDRWIELWAVECVQLMPFTAGGLPGEVRGRAAVRELYADMARNYLRLRFDDLQLHPMADPDSVLAQWKPRGQFTDGTEYANENIALFEFGHDGLIHRFTEYFNPAGIGDRFTARN